MVANVQSLQRAFKILYFVAGREGGCSVGEIASGVGLKQITAYKLIRTLEAEHFLVRLGTPVRYTLGHSIHELKHLDDGRVWLTESGKVLLQAQRDLPEANFVLLQYIEGNTYQRLLVRPENFGRLTRVRRYQVHPYEKASSLLFLAYGSPAETIRFHERHPFEDEGRQYWKSRDDLERFLATVRRRGYSRPELAHEIYCRAAAPVWSPSRSLLAAVGCFMPHAGTSKAKKQKMVGLCLRIAAVITKNLHVLTSSPLRSRDDDA